MLILIIVILLLGIFVWPTRYKYDHITYGNNKFPVRIDRLSGQAEALYPSGWTIITKGETKDSKLKELPFAELQKVTGKAWFTDYGYFKCKVYNGSDWTIKYLRVSVTIVNPDESEESPRIYKLIPKDGSCEPYTENEFFKKVGYELEEGQSFRWSLLSADGTNEG